MGVYKNKKACQRHKNDTSKESMTKKYNIISPKQSAKIDEIFQQSVPRKNVTLEKKMTICKRNLNYLSIFIT